MLSRQRLYRAVAIAAILLMAVGWLFTRRLPMARLRASGAPMTYADLVPKAVPAEQNAAAGIEALGPRLKALPEAFWNVGVDLADDPSQLEKAQQTLSEHSHMVDAVIEAAKRPDYASTLLSSQSDIDGSLLDLFVRLRAVFVVLEFQLDTSLGENNHAKAAETAILMLDLAKRIEREPFLSTRLLACAVQGIAIHNALQVIEGIELGEESLELIDQRFAAIEERSSLIPTLESERVLSLERMKTWSPPSRWQHSGSVLRFYEDAIEAMDCPAEQLVAAANRVNTSRNVIANMLAASLPSLANAELRTATQAREARQALRDLRDPQRKDDD